MPSRLDDMLEVSRGWDYRPEWDRVSPHSGEPLVEWDGRPPRERLEPQEARLLALLATRQDRWTTAADIIAVLAEGYACHQYPREYVKRLRRKGVPVANWRTHGYKLGLARRSPAR